MINHLLCHQDTSTDIDRKSVINHILRNFLSGVDTVHVTISRIVDQNIDLSISFKDFRLLSYDCYYQLSGTAVIAELAEVDTLPSAEVQSAIGDGNGDTDTAQRRFGMGRHIIGTF